MRVLHIYPKNEELIKNHVDLLTEGLRHSVEICTADNSSAIRQQLHDRVPDIVHCHSCWNYNTARAISWAIHHGARIVITLHGQLEPWVINQQSLHENISKTLLWQKRSIEKAYAVITFGKMECDNFKKLGWNPRIETIRNAVITNTISPSQMSAQTFAVYQKVMDSNTLEQMSDTLRQLLAAIIKVSITGDRRWLTESPDITNLTNDLTLENWRKLLVYAEHENIRNYVDYGINILGIQAPSIDTTKVNAFFPEGYQQPRPIKESIGDYQGKETEYLMRMFRQINKHPLLLNMIELTRELYRDTVDDDLISDQLDEKGLTSFAAGLMTVLAEQTLLDEGYMPIEAEDNKQAQQLRNLLTNHLKI